MHSLILTCRISLICFLPFYEEVYPNRVLFFLIIVIIELAGAASFLKIMIFVVDGFWTGAYDDEEAAARAYDLAALKYWGPGTLINFPVSLCKLLIGYRI